MPMNPKVLRIVRQPNGGAAAFAWVCSLSYSGFQNTGGFIMDEELHLVHCKPVLARILVKNGFWSRDEERGGYHVNDYDEYNQTRETTRHIKLQKKAGGIRGNHERHHDGKPIKCNCLERIAAVEAGKMVPPAWSEAVA